MKKSETKILIVEDDPSIRFGLSEVFASEGYEVASCDVGDQAEKHIAEELPDLIILDVMLPGKNGYEICRDLRKRGCKLPILMLTAKGQEIDKVVGLDSGADDYVTKPFGVQELVARVNALLRRIQRIDPPTGTEPVTPANSEPGDDFVVGEATISERTYEAQRNGDDEAQRLTPKEMELLKFLHSRRGQVLSRDAILDAVWGIQYFGTTRTLDQCVAQLRKKIGDSGGSPRFLKTVHGVGYQLETQ
ncbi:MAG: response regulator transcription factor [Verrucomicrobiales bacterium]|nr:response regulator transcription factor [Verrucomicrobiales bacterium]